MQLEKVTDLEHGPSRRSYDDACGAAHALDLVGERWALLVIRELMLGPKRFGDIRAGLPGISANVLSQRLHGLEATGVLEKRKLPPPASAQVYELTPWGYESEPIFQTLGRWAARSPSHDPRLPLSSTSLILSFRTMFDPAGAKGVKARIGLQLGGESFVMRISGGRIDARRGDPAGADLIISGSAENLAATVYGGVPLSALEAEGALTIAGDRKLAERLPAFFTLPPKV